MKLEGIEGAKAVVVGGGSGMGESISLYLAKEGADIAVPDIILENAERTADRVKSTGRKAIAMKVDVVDFQAVNDCMNSVYDQFKRIDILVNAAGYGQFVNFAEMTEEMWHRNIAVHLTGPFNAMRAVINGMISQRYGRIINISSVAGVTGTPRHSHYSAGKAGLIGLTKAVAKEVAPFGITVNAIAPRAIKTPWLEVCSNEQLQNAIKSTPVGRLGTTEEIAALCVYLASKEGGFITGAVVNVTGGFYM